MLSPPPANWRWTAKSDCLRLRRPGHDQRSVLVAGQPANRVCQQLGLERMTLCILFRHLPVFLSRILKEPISIGSFALTGMMCSLTACTGIERSPVAAEGSGAFATGHYRNLFAENGHSRKQIQEKVDLAFQQLFHGDLVSQTV